MQQSSATAAAYTRSWSLLPLLAANYHVLNALAQLMQRNTHELHTELYLTHSDSRWAKWARSASFARLHACAFDMYTHAERPMQKRKCTCPSQTGGNCWGRMCVSNKIPANYYYNDAFLEANWPPAKFIHLANVPYSVWLVYVYTYTGAPRRCMSLSLYHIAPRTLLWLLGIGQESSRCSTGGHLSHNS